MGEPGERVCTGSVSTQDRVSAENYAVSYNAEGEFSTDKIVVIEVWRDQEAHRVKCRNWIVGYLSGLQPFEDAPPSVYGRH